MNVSLGGTKMPSGLAEAAAGAGITISSATKFTGQFGISTSSTGLVRLGTEGLGFTVNVEAWGAAISVSPLYIAAEITDADETQWVAVSDAATVYILSTSLWSAIHVDVNNLRLNYKDGAGTVHTADYTGSVNSPVAWALGLGGNSSLNTVDDHATGMTSLTIACAQRTDFGSIKAFGDEIYVAGHNAATNIISFSDNPTATSLMHLPRPATTAAQAGDTSHWMMYTLKLNTRSGSGTYESYKVKATFETASPLSYGSLTQEDTLSLSQAIQEGSGHVYYVEVTNSSGTQLIKRYVTALYNQGWSDALKEVSMDSCTVTHTNAWGGSTNTVTASARYKYKASPGASSYSYSAYLGSSNSLTASANYTDTHSASLSGSASLSISGGMTLYNGKKYGYQDGSFTTNGTTYYIMRDVHTLGGDSGTENWYRYSNIGISDTHSASLSGDISVWIDWS